MIEASVLTINGYERRYAFSVSEFNPTLCQHIHAGRKTKYSDVVATFDIETTTIKQEAPYAFMYHWQMCIGGLVVFGRFWHELQLLHEKLVRYLVFMRKRKWLSTCITYPLNGCSCTSSLTVGKIFSQLKETRF